jgi:hypothetical protein
VFSKPQQQQQRLLLLLLLLAGKELYSKLQTTATTELQNKYKPKTWPSSKRKEIQNLNLSPH